MKSNTVEVFCKDWYYDKFWQLDISWCLRISRVFTQWRLFTSHAEETCFHGRCFWVQCAADNTALKLYIHGDPDLLGGLFSYVLVCNKQNKILLFMYTDKGFNDTFPMLSSKNSDENVNSQTCFNLDNHTLMSGAWLSQKRENWALFLKMCVVHVWVMMCESLRTMSESKEDRTAEKVLKRSCS